jgi:hypothetical protein
MKVPSRGANSRPRLVSFPPTRTRVYPSSHSTEYEGGRSAERRISLPLRVLARRKQVYVVCALTRHARRLPALHRGVWRPPGRAFERRLPLATRQRAPRGRSYCRRAVPRAARCQACEALQRAPTNRSRDKPCFDHSFESNPPQERLWKRPFASGIGGNIVGTVDLQPMRSGCHKNHAGFAWPSSSRS